ncbi:MAG: WD40 repeat domain-containing protein [bacterium]
MPLVFAKCGYTFPFRVAAYASDRRCFPKLVEALSGERFQHAAARAIGEFATHAPDLAHTALPGLRQLAEQSWWDSDDYLGAIHHKDNLRASLWALGRLGAPEDLDFLLKTAAEGPEPGQIAAAKAATELTLRHRLESEQLEAVLGHMLMSESPNPALFMLARLATDNAARLLKEFLAIRGGTAVAMAYANVMVAAMAHRRGEDVNWAKVLFAAQVSCENIFDEEELHLTVIELLDSYADRDTVETVLRQLVTSPRTAVRRAAQTRLADFGHVAFPADAVVVDEVFDADGFAGLTRLLEDADTTLRHNVLIRAAQADEVPPSFGAIAVETLKLLCHTPHYATSKASRSDDVLSYAIRAAVDLGLPEVDAFLGALFAQNRLYMKSVSSSDVQRLRDSGTADEGETGPKFDAFGDATWFAGAAIHGIARHADGRVFVATNAGLRVFSADGQRIKELSPGWLFDVQIQGQNVAVCGHGGKFELLDATTYDTKPTPSLRSGIRKARFSPDGSRVAVVSDGQYWAVVDVKTGEQTAATGQKSDVNGVDWIDNDRLVICTDRAVVLCSANGDEGRELKTGGGAEVRYADGVVYVSTSKGILRLNDQLDEAAPLLKQTGVARIEIRGNKLYAGSWETKDAGVWVWNLETGKRRRLKVENPTGVFGMDVSGDGEVLAGGNSREVQRWNAKGVYLNQPAARHTNEIAAIGAGRKGRVLTVSDDHQVIEWDLDTKAAMATWAFDFRTCFAQWSSDAQTLFVCGTENVVAMNADGTELWRNTDVARSEYLAVTDTAIVAASYNRLVWLDAKTGALVHATEPFADSFIFRWERLDNNRIAVAGYDDTHVFIFDLTSRELIDTVDLGAGGRMRAFARIDANRVAFTRWNDTLTIFNLSTHAPEKIVSGTSLDQLVFDPANDRLLAWHGNTIMGVGTDGEMSTVGRGPIAECAAFVGDRLVVGTKAGEVFVGSVA